MIRWYYPESTERLQGIALVIHGLNLHPAKMQAVVDCLTAMHIQTALLSLSGHGDHYHRIEGISTRRARMQTFKKVTSDRWRRETLSAYHRVGEEADRLGLPVRLVGYSLGGLLACNLVASGDADRIGEMVLFAPAITVHTFTYWIKLLKPFSTLVIPSLSPRHYRANHGTPVAAYRALLDANRRFRESAGPRLNIPTLVFIDPDDELVSCRRLENRVSELGLDRWEVYRIRKADQETGIGYHHLIIDAEAVGQTVWKDITDRMSVHFRPGRPEPEMPARPCPHHPRREPI